MEERSGLLGVVELIAEIRRNNPDASLTPELATEILRMANKPPHDPRNARYRTWACKLVIDANSATPPGFDGPPRNAAVLAVVQAGFPVIAMFSGWGGSLTDVELDVIEQPE